MNKDLYRRLIAMGVGIAAALAGSSLIAPSEGEVTHAYLDPVQIVTSCYGHTGADIKLGQQFTHEQCLEQFATDLKSHDKAMMKFIKAPLTGYQHAAFLSFCYNVGVATCSGSTAMRLLNEGKPESACKELTRWVFANGKKLAGLVTRRNNEMAMCLGRVDVNN